MTDTKYNGWTNYETWNAALWMGNDSFEHWDEMAQECYDESESDDIFTRKENASRDLAERMKQQHEEYAEEWMKDQASFFADIINAGLSSVNWDEIASGYIDEIDEDQEAA